MAPDMPLRAMFVNAWTECGGAEISLLTALAAADRRRIHPLAATLGLGNGNLPERLRAADVEVTELGPWSGRRPLAWMRTVAALTAAARRGRADMLVANGYPAHVFARPAALAARVPAVLFCRDFPRLSRPVPAVQRAAFALGAAMYLAASPEVASAVARRVGGRRPVRVVPSGVDTEAFKPDQAAGRRLREELGIPPETLVVTSVGRLEPWKGQHVFLDAAGRLAGAMPELRFLVVGDEVCCAKSDYPERLRDKAGSLGLGGKVTFAGWRSDMPAVYAASDIVVHCPVEPEPFGRVVAEAMAVGRAVVASREGGTAGLFVEGVNGHGHTPGDVVELTATIARLAADPELRAELGRQARRRALGSFTAQISAAALAEALETLRRPGGERRPSA